MCNNRNETLIWSEKQTKIYIDEKLKSPHNPIRGIYAIFESKNNIDECIYVGRSSDIYGRLFLPNGHIAKIRKKTHTLIEDLNKKISFKLLEEVDYIFDNYYLDMQKLASRESYYIDLYQSKGQCLKQVPEGTRMIKDKWEELKKLNKHDDIISKNKSL